MPHQTRPNQIRRCLIENAILHTAMTRLKSTDVVLHLRDALPAAAVQVIATSLSAVPGCSVSKRNAGPGTYFKVAVQLSSVTGKQGALPYSAAAVLQATAWVEENAQVRRGSAGELGSPLVQLWCTQTPVHLSCLQALTCSALAVLMPHDSRARNTRVSCCD
jgi:hypothetical protein